MPFLAWFLLIGLLLMLMAVVKSALDRLPLSASLLYLGAGVAAGPAGLGLLSFDPLGDDGAPVLERLAEVAVIVSLFSAGLKMRRPVGDGRWWLPVRLALVSMTVTIGLITAVGVYLLGLPLGGAVLLGAVLAPTDPVLASEVQLEHSKDDDRLRFALTGEAGLNDGAAFPFVMLGLGLLSMEYDLELHDLGAYGWRWWVIDVLWAIPGALVIGAIAGTVTGRLVTFLQRDREAAQSTDFLALGLIALSYGLALLAGTWAFLAVFAAGVALRAAERRHTERKGELADGTTSDPAGEVEAHDGDDPHIEHEALDAHDEAHEAPEDDSRDSPSPAHMASAALGFAERLEAIAEVAMVVIVGSLLFRYGEWSWRAVVFVPLVLLVIRPVSVLIGTLGDPSTWVQRGLIGWFGIRGIGSVYYLAHAENLGLPDPVASPILSLTLATVATSVVVHGGSVSRLMKWYRQREEGGSGA